MDTDINSSTDQMIDLQPDDATASNDSDTIDHSNPDDSTGTTSINSFFVFST
eukprot:CAMPEP_0201215938 /NCGR_PEP_ID=MMETSP0851-20130426/189244_1 /ASSEMBLY_ACC=CAM_ASM_000631 /TAXON_ID=183588 /ORGANISM="Pseudo-nitzschia fraudulenta, Strain WWA7" /LENGTH=51 /DNA_ID=CAMNT_0047505457 /DNA_START=1237 /DNA_END=1389 /DNA_ORIENTATION=+